MKRKYLAALLEVLYNPMMRFAVRTGALMPIVALELDKAAHDKLPKDVQALYKEDGGKFKLDAELPEDTGVAAKAALEAERAARRNSEKQLKELKKQFEGVDPEQFKKFMSHFDSEEDAELLKQGPAGIDKLVEKRIAKQLEAKDSEIAALREQVEGGLEVAGTFMDRVLDAHIISAAAKAGIHESAFDDVALRARSIFSVDDDGRAVQFEYGGEDDDEGTIVMGKDGKTPFSPMEWLEDMKAKAPHWWPASTSGGGAHGNRGSNNSSGKTIKRAQFDSLSPVEQHAKIKEGFTPVD